MLCKRDYAFLWTRLDVEWGLVVSIVETNVDDGGFCPCLRQSTGHICERARCRRWVRRSRTAEA